MTSYDILVAGEINPDLILTGDVIPEFGQAEKLVDTALFTIGSSSAIFACGAARLGLKVLFIGVCGLDLPGRFMLEQMDACGVDISNVIRITAGETGLSVILNRGSDRAILTFQGLMASLKATNVTDSLLRQARHLHVASYFLQTALQPGLPELFTRAHALGLSTSLDTNWDPSGEWRGLDALLSEVEVFLPNENEAMAFTSGSTPTSALEQLSRKVHTVAIKCGNRGALARNGEISATSPALPVQVVDTIGAGDSFDAGFLYGWLNRWSLEKTLQMATACGSLSTRGAGGTSTQPTLEEAVQYVH